MLLNASNTVIQLDANHPRDPQTNRNFYNELIEYNNSRKYYESIISVSMHSFVNICAVIYKVLWPSTIDFKGNIVQKRDKRKKDLGEFFPERDFINMEKHFRNFLEHIDERLDSWDTSSMHHNIMMVQLVIRQSQIKISLYGYILILVPLRLLIMI